MNRIDLAITGMSLHVATIVHLFNRRLYIALAVSGLCGGFVLAAPPQGIQKSEQSPVGQVRLTPRLDLKSLEIAKVSEEEIPALLDGLRTGEEIECQAVVTALTPMRDIAVVKLQEQFPKAPIVAQHRFAIVALHLGEPGLARSIGQPAENPAPRRLFQEMLTGWHGNVGELLQQVRAANDPSLRSTVCLSLGGMNPENLTPAERQTAQAFLLSAYEKSPDTATHGAADWALRRWEQELPTLRGVSKPSETRKWYVNSAGMTMLEIAPGKFRMGSERDYLPKSVDVTLTRAYFLADREVSVGQFRQFLDDPKTPAAEKPENWKGHDPLASPTDAHPMQCVNWFDSVLFLNWLSRREGLRPAYVRTGKKERLFDGVYDI